MSTGFDRGAADGLTRGTRALLVLPLLGNEASRSPEARLDEAQGLAEAIGIDVRARDAIRVRAPRAATLIGKGQAETLKARVAEEDAKLVVVDAAITAVQQKNLEDALGAKIIDRTGLILEIFGERAATAEGRLQVELAHLSYQSGRLVRSWTHLERQRGGFGFLGGPGETQIEADRRLIRDRMAKLRRELESVSRTRTLHRARRQKAPWPVVALVGYTNAGKSTLFNRLTAAEVRAEDLLFATLDPTMRELKLRGAGKAILSDTVGFVSDLPTELVAAFRATLEEVVSADLLVHVRDIAHPDTEEQAEDVARVLRELGAEAPVLELWNKMDLVEGEERERLETEAARREDVLAISALTGEGVDAFLDEVAARVRGPSSTRRVRLDPADGAGMAWLRAHGEVLDEEGTDEALLLTIRMPEPAWARYEARAPLS